LGRFRRRRARPDTRFVLDRLATINRRGRFAGRLDLAHIGMVGHSLGGATAAEVMLVDERVDAALNLDGLITPNVVRHGLDRPFMVINAPPQPLPKGWPFTEGYDRGPGSVWEPAPRPTLQPHPDPIGP
jgi:predicted dienelactone hydrolase